MYPSYCIHPTVSISLYPSYCIHPTVSILPDTDAHHKSQSVAQANVEEATEEIVIPCILTQNYLVHKSESQLAELIFPPPLPPEMFYCQPCDILIR